MSANMRAEEPIDEETQKCQYCNGRWDPVRDWREYIHEPTCLWLVSGGLENPSIQCVGEPRRGNLWDPPHQPPCGWRGPLLDASLGSPPRCPRCGGRVELIPEDGGS